MTAMDITFNPPIGESIHLATSLSSQTTQLRFTAEFTAHVHNKLIQDRARVQLWSDLPHNGQLLSDVEWDALDFTGRAPGEEISSHKVSLASTYSIHANEEKVTLFLEVVVALPGTSRFCFSFTYRIAYPSGDIKWLGAFGQNGSLLFERSDHDLRNFGLDSWIFDKSRMAHIYEVKHPVDALDVARVRNVSNYCVRAIGPTSFVSDLKEAALFFLIPQSQPSAINLSPTCIFSASPGVSLTLSTEGRIAASGSGTLLFQVNEGHSKPFTFIRQLLSHAKLDRWNLLAWDADSKAVVLASPGDKLPIRAVTIPLWCSERPIRPIYLETTALSDMLGTTEYSIFSPDNMRIHLFTVNPLATPKNQMVLLQTDSTGNNLVMSPIYTLRGYQSTTDKSATIWKTVILGPYQVQDFPSDDSGILPTPPPSPHLQPIAHLSQVHAPCDTAMSSVLSLPPDTCTSLQSPTIGNYETETVSSTPIIPDTDTLPVQKPSTPRSILTMFRTFFYSVFFSVFYGLFWGNRTSSRLSHNGTTEDPPQLQASTGWEDDVQSPLDGDESRDEVHGLENLEILETKISLESAIETQAIQIPPSPSGAEIREITTKGGHDALYVDLQSEPSDSRSKNKTTIALLCTTHNDAEDANHNAPDVVYNHEIMEHCVQFLDRSEPKCMVSRCSVDTFCHGRIPGERTIGSYSCCLLQYQLDWSSDPEKPGRTVRISPPSVDFST